SKLTYEGAITADLVDLRNVTLPDGARVELPDVKRKDLQEIDRPDDVVLVKNGKPIDRKHRQLLKEQQQQQGTGGSAASGPSQAPRLYSFQITAPDRIFIHSS